MHVPDHVTENIEAVAALRQKTARAVNRHQRAVETVMARLGRPRTIYVVITVVLLWIASNLIVPAFHVRAPDPPPFFWLQGIIALYAALTTTVVLTTQNRQNREAEERAELEFQINLMAEQRSAKIVALLEELRRDLPNVRNRRDSVAEAMQETVDPPALLSALKETMEPREDEPDPKPAKGD